MTTFHDLKRIELFQKFDDKDLEDLGKRCQWRTYSANQEILSQFDDTGTVFFLMSGKARVIMYSALGKSVAFRDMGPGEMFGELAAIDAQPRSASVRALEPSCIASMSSSVFRETLIRYPNAIDVVLRHLVSQVRALTDRVYEFSTLSVKHRVHAELLRLAHRFANGSGEALIDPAPTHEEFANLISTHRQAVTSELNRLAQCGLVERVGKTLHIKDMERLDQLVANAAQE